MQTCTVYNCGTNYSHESNDVIARLEKVTASVYRTINDGPGAHEKGLKNLPGAGFGVGVDANVVASLDCVNQMISDQTPDNTKPDDFGRLVELNMAGWSRGAVTCFKIANQMSKDARLKKIPVNIFAIDPVPGSGGTFNKHMWREIELTGNVKNCLTLVAQHERRRYMRVALPVTIPPGCKYEAFLMPGVHSTLVEPQGDPVCDLVWNLAKRFLSSHHTAFTERQISLPNRKLIELYSEAAARFEQYQLLGKSGEEKWYHEGRGVASQDLKGSKVTTIHEGRYDEFFINGHHKRLYELEYPKLYHELTLNEVRAFDPLRSAGFRKEYAGMLANGYTESARQVREYVAKIGKFLTKPLPPTPKAKSTHA